VSKVVTNVVHRGDCLEIMRTMPDSCIDLIATDPPYYRVKGEWWNRQWDTRTGFLAWIGQLCEQWRRILRPNGSLYVFASPQMRAHVEVEVGKWFNCLPTVTWVKAEGWHKKTCKADVRAYLPQTEAIIFAEQGLDGVCEPVRQYLVSERDRAGWTTRRVAEAFQQKTGSRTVTGMAGHWFGRVQWRLPTRENYQWLRALFNNANGGDYLRREYDDLRRPFSVTADVPYTDVWNFPTVQAYPGKHPCEKPAALARHIVQSSSRVGATVLDCFAGSGVICCAAQELGRAYIGIEIDRKWAEIARARLAGN